MVGAINRRNSYLKAVRKRRLHPGYYNNLHQYSKNKIHCSCCLCSAKTRIDGSKYSDRKRLNRLEYVE